MMTESFDKGLANLLVWQKASQFAVHVCKMIIVLFPEQEKFALVSQIRRSAQSIPANIAEGHGRFYFQETARFAYIARGSLEETYSHLVYAHEMNYLSDTEFSDLNRKYDELLKMINGYINYIKRSKRGISEPGSVYFADHNV
jgi:four helix bundle protein